MSGDYNVVEAFRQLGLDTRDDEPGYDVYPSDVEDEDGDEVEHGTL